MPNPEPAEIPRAELTPWARDELNMGASAGADEFRRTLFQRLEKENWVPPCEAQYALETLALRSAEDRKAAVGVGGGAFFWSAEKKLREEVERFAASFFELPPPQRTAEYRKLEERCRLFPTLAHRLRGLKPGLDVVIPQVGFDRATLDLAEHLSRLFVLRPNDRAQLRRTPDERLAKTLPQWREAAARLQRQLPQVAKLEPGLVESLATAKARGNQAAVSQLGEPLRRNVAVSAESPYAYREQRGRFSGVLEASLESFLRRGAWAFVVAIFVGIRACSSGLESPPIRIDPNDAMRIHSQNTSSPPRRAENNFDVLHEQAREAYRRNLHKADPYAPPMRHHQPEPYLPVR
jgi:hypothetical protein